MLPIFFFFSAQWIYANSAQRTQQEAQKEYAAMVDTSQGSKMTFIHMATGDRHRCSLLLYRVSVLNHMSARLALSTEYSPVQRLAVKSIDHRVEQ